MRNRSASASVAAMVVGIVAALVALSVVFIGFARTYYLKGLFEGAPLGGMVHLHGALMTAWLLLFFIQATLIRAERVQMHRRLGLTGALLAAAVVAAGTFVAISAAARGVAPPGLPPLVFLAIPLVDMFLFAFFVSAALSMRRHGDWHKRLMLLATLSILVAAISRIPLEFIEQGGPLVFFGLTDLVITAFVACDTAVNRRLHPAFGNLKKEEMVSDALSVPLHKGAEKYYREVGLIK